jgi:hypothetical protein
MPLTRRRFVASLTAGSAAWFAQHETWAAGMPDMPEDEQAMQTAQRGGLYANLRDPSVTQLPPEAFTQRFFYSSA